MTRKDWTDEKLFYRLLNNKSKRTYWDNITALRHRPTREVFNRCVELINNGDVKSREIGITVLSQLGAAPRPFYKETLKLFVGLLEKEKDVTILFALIYGLGHNNEKLSPVQVRKLCSFKNTSNTLIREAVTFALGGIDDVNAIEALIELSADKSGPIRNWATFGIGSLTERDTPTIREALWNRVDDKHQETKLEAIAGLAARKDGRVIDVIKKELISGEYGTLLFEAIVSLGDKQFIPLLKGQLKTAKKDHSVNRDWLKDLENCIKELEHAP